MTRSARFSVGRSVAVLSALLLLAVFSFALAVSLGEQPLSLAGLGEPGSTEATIFFSLRLPRAFLAALVGAALAASGCSLQGLMRNPLADPFVLGVSGGAALGATVAFALGLGTLAGADALLGRLGGPSTFAWLGALGATFLVLSLGRAAGGRSLYATLLSGVIFNAFALAVITFVKTLASPDRLGEILYWLAGSLGYEDRSTLGLAFLLQALAIGTLWALSAKANLLALGDDAAASLGVHVERTRMIILVAASLSVSGAVALSGLVGFVGLIVPHLLRLWLGPDQRLLLPASVLGGASFLLLSDLGARMLFGVFNAEPPVGAVTALLGGPLFLLLLYRRPASG